MAPAGMSRASPWIVLNQSQSPAFQAMFGRLADRFGPCVLLTGAPHPNAGHRNLELVKGPTYDRRSVARRAASWSAFVAAAAARIARTPGTPFLFATTNPPMLPQLLWAAHKSRGLPYGLLIWDIYPEHVVRRGWLGETNAIVRAWTKMNAVALRDADVVVTLSERMAETVAGQLRRAGYSRAIEVIPNWADVDVLQPIPKAQNSFAIERALVEPLTILYSGNIGATHGLESVIEAASVLRDDARVRFVVIGDGLGRAALEQKVRELALENVHLEPMLPWDMVPRSLASGDVAVVVQEPGTEHLSMPSKTYSALAVGSALLALTSPKSDLATLTADLEVGVVCSRDDSRAIVSSIRRFLDDPKLLARCRENSRRAAVERFSAQAVFTKFEAAFRASFEVGVSDAVH